MKYTTLSLSTLMVCGVLGGCAGAQGPTATVAAPTTPATTSVAATSTVLNNGGGADMSGRFVVTLQPGVDAQSIAAEYGVKSDAAFSGTTAAFTGINESIRKRMSGDVRIQAIEADQFVAVSGKQIKAPWGLDRLDQARAPLSTTYSYDASGSGVTAYVVDSGVMSRHISFDGRVKPGFDVIGDGRNGEDCSGHGTHVAGIIGGWTTGVAKSVEIVSVRVFDCNNTGTLSGVISGLDWIAANHRSPSVANLSFNAGTSTALDAAVRRLIASGVVVVVAAGNGGGDACNNSPARVQEALTVGASDENDVAAAFSNSGACVDMYAPGVNILSTWDVSDNSLATGTGTSMAAPFAAGVAAMYLEKNRNATPAEVVKALEVASYKGTVTAADGHRYDLLSSDVVR